MLFQLPDHNQLYAALVARDDSYEGRAYVGVSSTGIFCRLTCSARKPKPENCRFFATVHECLDAGYRPCKRCHPLTVLAKSDPIILQLVEALEADPFRRWREQDVVAFGFDPSTVRRSFRRVYGITFLEMARLRRLQLGFQRLAEGEKVIEAQLEAQFESPAAFREAFAHTLGLAPGKFMKDALLQADIIETPIGTMVAIADNHSLHLLEFFDRKALSGEMKKLLKYCKNNIGFGCPPPLQQTKKELQQYFNGERCQFTVPLTMHGSPFTRSVWQALCTIPAGETRSYLDIAAGLGKPTATRAVARANGANQIAIIIPCHRVIGADGSLTGYGGGLWRKQFLIDLENQYRSSDAERALA